MQEEKFLLIQELIRRGKWSINLDTGEVINLNTGRSSFDIKPDMRGYQVMMLRVNGKRIEFKVHHIVAVAGGLYPVANVIDHVDGNKQNNALSNLEVVSLSENNRRAHAMGLATHPPIYPQRGVDNPRSVLTENQVLEIKRRLANGERNVDIARDFGVNKSRISNIKRGVSWAHVTL